MNYQHHNIKLFFEVGKSNNFSFLDVKICRENNKFTTSVFRKSTFSRVFTNFDCFIHISYKHGLYINTYILMYKPNLFLLWKTYNQIAYLKDIFKRNRYCNDFVDLCIKKFSGKLDITKKIYKRLRKSNYWWFSYFWVVCVLRLGKNQIAA